MVAPSLPWLSRLLLALILTGLPGTAHAHSPIAGAGDVVNGLLHPLLSPTHVLVLLALGLTAGRGQQSDLKLPMFAFIPLSALGLFLTTTGWIEMVHPTILIGIALVPASLLALEKMPPRSVLTALFGCGALALGLDSRVESSSASSTNKVLLANWISLNVLVADVAIYLSLIGAAKWLKIALRIVGSWMIAIGVLVLAFALRR
jgi:urease accessory protein